jgi:hypothetical protein
MGSVSTVPKQALHQVIALGKTARQGRALPQTQLLIRFAAGEEIAENLVRQELRVHLARINRRFAGDLGNDDVGWQARHDAARRVARTATSVSLSDLLAAADDPDHPPVDSEEATRGGAEAIVRLMIKPDEVGADDVLRALTTYAGATEADWAQIRDAQLQAELTGVDPVKELGRAVSLERIRKLADQAPFGEIRRALSTLYTVWALHGLLAVGVLQAFAEQHAPDLLARLPERLLRLPNCVREIAQDPIWHRWGQMPPLSAAGWNLGLTSCGLLLLTHPGELVALECYRDRLNTVLGYSTTQPPIELDCL